MSNRISSSILRNYVNNLYLKESNFNKILNFSETKVQKALQDTPLQCRQDALRQAQRVTYQDLSPYETLRKKPYLIKGKVFEQLLTNSVDEKNLLIFDNLRSKKNRQAVIEQCEEKGKHCNPISANNYKKLVDNIKVIHNTYLNKHIQELTGFDTLGSLFYSEQIQYSVKLAQKLSIKGREYYLTGECDALLPLPNNTNLIFEFKTSSKMYYPNHIHTLIRKNNYDFQVTFYTYLLSLRKMNPLPYTIFLMANPSSGVFNHIPFYVKDKVNLAKFGSIINSL